MPCQEVQMREFQEAQKEENTELERGVLGAINERYCIRE